MANDINQRFFELRKYMGLSREAFGAEVGVSASVIRNIECSFTEPKPLLIRLVCEKYSVNERWLVSGEGEMFKPKELEDKIIDAFGKVVKMPDDAFTKQFIAALAELTPEQWEMVEEFANKIVGNRDKKEKKEKKDD